MPSNWCVVANVLPEPHPPGPGRVMRLGTRYFAPGAKVYCWPFIWGDGGDRLKVLGRHRGGRRLVTVVTRTKLLTDWRAKRMFDPAVIRELEGLWHDTEDSKAEAERMAGLFLSRSTPPEA